MGVLNWYFGVGVFSLVFGLRLVVLSLLGFLGWGSLHTEKNNPGNKNVAILSILQAVACKILPLPSHSVPKH